MTLVKTSVMMIGEFEYESIFHGLGDVTNQNSADGHEARTYYEILSYLMFVVFMILMSIIIMNLLVSFSVLLCF